MEEKESMEIGVWDGLMLVGEADVVTGGGTQSKIYLLYFSVRQNRTKSTTLLYFLCPRGFC